MKYIINDSQYPTVDVTLEKDEKVIANSGALCWRDASFSMETKRNEANEDVITGLFSRKHFFMNEFVSLQNNSKITFGSCVPGSIKVIELKDGELIICQNGALLFALGDVKVSVFFNKKVGLLGGEAFVLEKIVGPGTVFLEIDGEEVNKELSENETLVISEGHLVSISEGCMIDVQSNKGLKNILFSGEGLFTTTVTGPGNVILQSMPIEKLAGEVNPHISHPENGSN